MTIGSLFSGIGGLELGLELCGLGPVAWQRAASEEIADQAANNVTAREACREAEGELPTAEHEGEVDVYRSVRGVVHAVVYTELCDYCEAHRVT